jgi:hypothetical protein
MTEFTQQLIQVVGAILILVAYVLAQFKYLSQHSAAYLLANLIGSIVLAVLAYIDSQWGFLLLESVWALVSGINLVRLYWSSRSQ